jgi:HEPN domain-containing protein
VAKEIDLMKLVLEMDDQLIQKGVEPFQRPFHACLMIAESLVPGGAIPLDDPLFQAINQIYGELYRPVDLYMPPMYVGAFMFRDVFFPLRIPPNLGSGNGTNPVNFLEDVPETPKRWLFNDRQIGLTFFDQVIDVMDFVYGLDDIEKIGQLPGKTVEYWYLAKQQLEAAAATLLGSFNKYAVIQNCCIATELLLKGALIAKGMDANTLRYKPYGHDFKNLVNKTAELVSSIDQEMLVFTVRQLPDYINSRYEAKEISRLDLGKFLMNTQFISGEILRQFSNRDFRSDFCRTLDEDWNITHRTFPQK